MCANYIRFIFDRQVLSFANILFYRNSTGLALSCGKLHRRSFFDDEFLNILPVLRFHLNQVHSFGQVSRG